MPELPEVEVVRAGLAPAVTGSRIAGAEVRDARALKRHVPLGGDGAVSGAGRSGHGVTLSPEAGAARAADFERRVTGLRLLAPRRRGKFLWIPVDPGATPGAAPVPDAAVSPAASPHTALLAHLGMSGQLLLRSNEAPDDRHVRIRLWLECPGRGSGGPRELRLDFVDQRLFGSLALDSLVPTAQLHRGTAQQPGGTAQQPGAGELIPAQAIHIARDPLDPAFDDRAFAAGLLARGSAVKKLLLDQSLVSGVGNIYADEALWRARLHPERPGASLSARKTVELLAALRAVFAQALAEGGTSFDAQYVNVNGQAGYFSRYLHSYGRTGEPCDRCGTKIKRIPLGGRSSHFCPRCQRLRQPIA